MTTFPTLTLTALTWGLGVLAAGLLLARVARMVVSWVLKQRGRSPGSADVFGRVTSVVLGMLAVGAALTVIFPSVKPVDILGGFGVISIAAGIAFQTVLGNIFAGMIILGRDRFGVGDQIWVGEHRGTVVEMQLSHTAIKSFDGRLVLIPNQLLHSKPVTVQTGFEAVLSSLQLDLDDATDLDRARQVAVEAMAALREVLPEPAPQALLTSIGVTTVSLQLRFWSGARQMETREAQDAVIAAVLGAFAREGIRTGNDVRIVDLGPQLQRLAGRLMEDLAPDTTEGSTSLPAPPVRRP